MKTLFIFLIFFPSLVFAELKVAFLQMKSYSGEVIRLEPDGEFAHIAISYKDRWLHAHPVRGVEVVLQAELQKMGEIVSVMILPDRGDLDEDRVRELLGRPYDPEFSWSGDKVYCSELVGKLLELEPQPMTFSAKFWSGKYQQLRGKLGLSPDDIYRALARKGYRPQRFTKN